MEDVATLSSHLPSAAKPDLAARKALVAGVPRSGEVLKSLFAAGRAVSSTLDAEDPDPPEPECSIISSVADSTRVMRVGPRADWPTQLVALSLGAITVRDARPSYSPPTQLVYLLYVALGMEPSVIRAHDGIVYFWSLMIQA